MDELTFIIKFVVSSWSLTADPTQQYTVLNTSDHRNLVLQSGDVIDVKIVSQSGSVDIEVQNSEGESIYKEADVPTSNFEIKILQDDTYQFIVTGHQAKGSVSFIKK